VIGSRLSPVRLPAVSRQHVGALLLMLGAQRMKVRLKRNAVEVT
jgi:hypothetical protein